MTYQYGVDTGKEGETYMQVRTLGSSAARKVYGFSLKVVSGPRSLGSSALPSVGCGVSAPSASSGSTSTSTVTSVCSGVASVFGFLASGWGTGDSAPRFLSLWEVES